MAQPQGIASAVEAEAHREGMRRAMSLYQEADRLFYEPRLQRAYLVSLARELRRLLREPKP